MSKNIEQIQEKIVPILKRAGVLRSFIFGSVARGEATAESDVDILVELPKQASLLDLVGLKQDLEKALDKKVDVVEYISIKPALRENILSSQVAII
jgi:predicted nucleotidyltransferase